MKSMKKSKRFNNVLVYTILTVLSVIWILPILWIVMISFRAEQGAFKPYFFPKGLSLDNYIRLFSETQQFYFFRWFLNTLFVAICSCIISTFFVLSVSYVMSRLR